MSESWLALEIMIKNMAILRFTTLKTKVWQLVLKCHLAPCMVHPQHHLATPFLWLEALNHWRVVPRVQVKWSVLNELPEKYWSRYFLQTSFTLTQTQNSFKLWSRKCPSGAATILSLHWRNFPRRSAHHSQRQGSNQVSARDSHYW